MCPSTRWERRPDDRPNEILDAALAVFAERGYRNTRLEHVGEAAGVTKGTIYHYFANKEDLLLRAIEHRREEAFGAHRGDPARQSPRPCPRASTHGPSLVRVAHRRNDWPS